MDMVLSWVMPVLYGGMGNLAAYLAAHVLLCLLPAFFIAGAMSALIPKETVTRFLGRNSRKAVSYPAAAAAGSLLAVLSHIVRHRLNEDELRDWLWESWRFVKQIFPLLVVGVFIVGMIRVLIRPEWIQMLAGTNSLTGNMAGVVFGVFMYFPTLVEVPIAKMFLELGMHRGTLLAYLMSDPELSLQSILIISAIIGRKKTFTYVGLVALFSAAAGLIYGAWIDGASLLVLALYLVGFIALLAVLLSVASRHASSLKGV